MKAVPSLTIGSAGSPMPSMPVIASLTAAAWSAFATTWMVLDASARPWSASISWPSIDSMSVVYCSSVGMPDVSSWRCRGTPAARRAVVAAQTLRG